MKLDRFKKFFSKIQNRDDAAMVVRYCAYTFWAIAAYGAVLGLMIPQMEPVIMDAAIMAVLTTALYLWKSRIAAILLMVLTLGELAVTFYNTQNPNNASGGSNLILAAVMAYFGVRAVIATFKYHTQFRVVL